MSNTYVDVSNTTSSNVKRSTDTDVNGSNIVNNAIYSGNVDADLAYREEEAPQNSNNIDTDSSLEILLVSFPWLVHMVESSYVGSVLFLKPTLLLFMLTKVWS
jgi:hypothetical protein